MRPSCSRWSPPGLRGLINWIFVSNKWKNLLDITSLSMRTCLSPGTTSPCRILSPCEIFIRSPLLYIYLLYILILSTLLSGILITSCWYIYYLHFFIGVLGFWYSLSLKQNVYPDHEGSSQIHHDIYHWPSSLKS